MPALVDDEPYFTLAPDWVCEVLSPRTAKLDRACKLPVYARASAGAPPGWWTRWLARSKCFAARAASGSSPGSRVDDAPVRAEPFDAIELDLAVLWADVQLVP